MIRQHCSIEAAEILSVTSFLEISLFMAYCPRNVSYVLRNSFTREKQASARMRSRFYFSSLKALPARASIAIVTRNTIKQINERNIKAEKKAAS